jgi:hypothetical protein
MKTPKNFYWWASPYVTNSKELKNLPRKTKKRFGKLIAKINLAK